MTTIMDHCGNVFYVEVVPILPPGYYWRINADSPWQAMGGMPWKLMQFARMDGQYLWIEAVQHG